MNNTVKTCESTLASYYIDNSSERHINSTACLKKSFFNVCNGGILRGLAIGQERGPISWGPPIN